MAHPEREDSKLLLAKEIAVLSDAELDRYLDECRDGAGVVIVAVKDPENLSESSIERLRERAPEAIHAAVNYQSLDIDCVNATISDISENDSSSDVSENGSHSDAGSQSPNCQGGQPLPSPPNPHKALAVEYCRQLISDGGRPPYPVESFEKIIKDPEQYCKLLLPWLEDPDVSLDDIDESTVPRAARERWRNFRVWQRTNRGLEDDGGLFRVFVEEYKRKRRDAYGLGWLTGNSGEKLTKAQVMKSLRGLWRIHEQGRENEQRKLRPEAGYDLGGLAEYAGEVKHRLARNNFTRIFELDKDPQRQDKLTTWIEYFDYECAWYEHDVRRVERAKANREEEWAKLVGTGLLRPHETNWDAIEAAHPQRQDEQDQAKIAVEAAESAAKSVQTLAPSGSQDPSASEEERARRATEAKIRVDTEMANLEFINSRARHIRWFLRAGLWNYGWATKALEQQTLLMQWTRQQISEIEAELNKEQDDKSRLHSVCSAKKEPESDENAAPGSKAAKQGDEETAAIEDRKKAETRHARSEVATSNERPSKRSREDELGNGTEVEHSKRQRSAHGEEACEATAAVPSSQSPQAVRRRKACPAPATLRRSARIRAREEKSKLLEDTTSRANLAKTTRSLGGT